MKVLTKQEILMAASGKDMRGLPKCSMMLENKLAKGGSDLELIDTVVVNTATLNVFRTGKYVIVDVVFPTYMAVELRDMYNSLQRFGQAKNSFDENSQALPLSFLTIVPEELDGRYYMVAVSPLFWALQNENIDDKYPNVIKMVFENEDFLFYESEFDEETEERIDTQIDAPKPRVEDDGAPKLAFEEIDEF